MSPHGPFPFPGAQHPLSHLCPPRDMHGIYSRSPAVAQATWHHDARARESGLGILRRTTTEAKHVAAAIQAPNTPTATVSLAAVLNLPILIPGKTMYGRFQVCDPEHDCRVSKSRGLVGTSRVGMPSGSAREQWSGLSQARRAACGRPAWAQQCSAGGNALNGSSLVPIEQRRSALALIVGSIWVAAPIATPHCITCNHA